MTLRRTALAVILALCPLSALAESYSFDMPKAEGTSPSTAPDRADRKPEPIDRILQDLLRRAQPHLEGLAQEMQGTMHDLAPAFKELTGLIDDIGNYQTPERLPNGDIMIRRRADAPPPPPVNELPNLLPQRQTPPSSPAHPPAPAFDPTRPQIDL